MEAGRNRQTCVAPLPWSYSDESRPEGVCGKTLRAGRRRYCSRACLLEARNERRSTSPHMRELNRRHQATWKARHYATLHQRRWDRRVDRRLAYLRATAPAEFKPYFKTLDKRALQVAARTRDFDAFWRELFAAGLLDERMEPARQRSPARRRACVLFVANVTNFALTRLRWTRSAEQPEEGGVDID